MRLSKIIRRFYQKLRIRFYKSFSTCANVVGKPIILQPTLLNGGGKIIFGENVSLGYNPSPNFLEGISYIEARKKQSKVIFGNKIHCNNNLKIICEQTEIVICDNVLIGYNVEILDSNFHELNYQLRGSGNHSAKKVIINRNVFIGNNVTILKGVEIGENSVIANGAVVTKSFPSNVIIGGNPAFVIKNISD